MLCAFCAVACFDAVDLSDLDAGVGDGPRRGEDGSIDWGEDGSVDVPDADAPDGDVPDGDVPDADVPDADVPDGDVPDADVPDGDVPDGDVPDADVPDGEVPDADVPDGGVEVMDCADLCADYLDWTVAELQCVAGVLRIAGYAPGAESRCRRVRDPADCEQCLAALDASDLACVGLASLCMQ